ncbi:MAG: transposase, partial [Chlamydiota bacterium]
MRTDAALSVVLHSSAEEGNPPDEAHRREPRERHPTADDETAGHVAEHDGAIPRIEIHPPQAVVDPEDGKWKTISTSFGGNIDLEVPRDRIGDFSPIVIPKYTRTIPELEAQIISMYAKGMSTRDIQSHIEDIYGTNLSAATISNITDKM